MVGSCKRCSEEFKVDDPEPAFAGLCIDCSTKARDEADSMHAAAALVHDELMPQQMSSLAATGPAVTPGEHLRQSSEVPMPLNSVALLLFLPTDTTAGWTALHEAAVAWAQRQYPTATPVAYDGYMVLRHAHHGAMDPATLQCAVCDSQSASERHLGLKLAITEWLNRVNDDDSRVESVSLFRALQESDLHEQAQKATTVVADTKAAIAQKTLKQYKESLHVLRSQVLLASAEEDSEFERRRDFLFSQIGTRAESDLFPMSLEAAQRHAFFILVHGDEDLHTLQELLKEEEKELEQEASRVAPTEAPPPDQEAIDLNLETESQQLVSEEDSTAPVLALEQPPTLAPAAADLTDPLHCFHPTQRQVARRLADVIEALYSRDEFARFKRVEFRVFVPIFNQLVLQTLARVIDSGLAPDERELDLAKAKRVFSYHVCNASEDGAKESHLLQLRRAVKEQPDTLFLLIADECEWAATPGQGNDALVNDRELNAASNAVYLLVSATPEALLSSSSRVELLKPLQRRLHGAEQQVAQQLQSLLSRHVRWFEEQAVQTGVQFILRSFHHLHFVSTVGRIHEHAGSPLADAAAATAVCMSGDSSFTIDLFQLTRVSNEVLPAPATAASSNSAAPPAALSSPSKRRARTSLEPQREEHRAGRAYLVLIKRTASLHYLCMDTAAAHPLALSGNDALGLAGFNVKLSSDEKEAELRLQVFNDESFFKLSTERGGVRYLLCSYGAAADLHVCFVPESVVQTHGAVLKSEWYMGELYHGYRSLTLYVSTLHASTLHQPRQARRIRADPHFADRNAKKHASLCSDFLREARGNSNLLFCARKEPAECCKVHSNSSPFESKKKNARMLDVVCFTLGHLLLADYVFHILRFAALPRSGSGSVVAGSIPDFALLERLLSQYESQCASRAACPLRFVQQFYQHHHAALLLETKKPAAGSDAISPELQQRWNAARQYLDPQQLPEQLKQWAPISFDRLMANAVAAESDLSAMSETAGIVHQLLAPLNGGGSAVRGKMIVLRVDDNKQGSCFAAGLALAMRLVRQQQLHDAVIIPDFGKFAVSTMAQESLRRLQTGRACREAGCTCTNGQTETRGTVCTSCQHTHVRATQYEDLLHLPCIVLLNEKGRMGDTFPHSFACMDLRLRYQTDVGCLRSVTQELGRMCRYVCPRVSADGTLRCCTCDALYDEDWAFALVGHKLAKWLDTHVTLDPEQVSEVGQLPLSDKLRGVSKASKEALEAVSLRQDQLLPPRIYLRFEANDKNYDSERTALTPRHERRIVLHAECQIGKTGSYLATLAQLKHRVEGAALALAAIEEPVACLHIPLLSSDPWNDDEHPRAENVFGRTDGKNRLLFPHYHEMRVGKYHSRVLLGRLAHLRTLRERADWPNQFAAWLRQFPQELSVCQEAQARVQVLVERVMNLPGIDASIQELFASPAIRAALDYDGRMQPLLRCIDAQLATEGSSSSSSGSSSGAGMDRVENSAFAVRQHALQLWRNGTPPPTIQAIWTDQQPGKQGSGGSATQQQDVASVAHGELEMQSDGSFQPAWWEEDTRTFPAGARGYRTQSSAAARQLPPAKTVPVRFVYHCNDNFRVQGKSLFVGSPPVLHLSAPSKEQADEFFLIDWKRSPAEADGVRALALPAAASPLRALCNVIFHFTYNRKHRALLDYTVALDGYSCRRVVVVRSSEFEEQVKEWGSTLVVLALPPEEVKMRYPIFGTASSACSWALTDAVSGGTGFARFLVHVLAHQWGLPAIWMLDDNIMQFAQCSRSIRAGDASSSLVESADDAGDTVMENAGAAAAAPASTAMAVRQAGEHELVVQTVSIGHALSSLEQLQYDDAKLAELTGGWARYAVIGTARDLDEVYIEQRRRLLVTQPHRVTHCYSAFLLNVQATCTHAQPVLFPPRLVWQDIEFNALAIDAGLAVVKYARFMHFKRNFTPALLRQHMQPAASRVYTYPDSQPLYAAEWTPDQVASALALELSSQSKDAWLERVGQWLQPLHCVIIDVSGGAWRAPQVTQPITHHVVLHSGTLRLPTANHLAKLLVHLSVFLAALAEQHGEVLVSMPLLLVQRLCEAASSRDSVAAVNELLDSWTGSDYPVLPSAHRADCQAFGSCPGSQLGSLQSSEHGAEAAAHWIGIRMRAADAAGVAAGAGVAAAAGDMPLLEQPFQPSSPFSPSSTALTQLKLSKHSTSGSSNSYAATSDSPAAAAAAAGSVVSPSAKRRLEAASPSTAASSAAAAAGRDEGQQSKRVKTEPGVRAAASSPVAGHHPAAADAAAAAASTAPSGVATSTPARSTVASISVPASASDSDVRRIRDSMRAVVTFFLCELHNTDKATFMKSSVDSIMAKINNIDTPYDSNTAFGEDMKQIFNKTEIASYHGADSPFMRSANKFKTDFRAIFKQIFGHPTTTQQEEKAAKVATQRRRPGGKMAALRDDPPSAAATAAATAPARPAAPKSALADAMDETKDDPALCQAPVNTAADASKSPLAGTASSSASTAVVSMPVLSVAASLDLQSQRLAQASKLQGQGQGQGGAAVAAAAATGAAPSARPVRSATYAPLPPADQLWQFPTLPVGQKTRPMAALRNDPPPVAAAVATASNSVAAALPSLSASTAVPVNSSIQCQAVSGRRHAVRAQTGSDSAQFTH